MQKLKQFTLTREEAFKLHMEYTRWRADARLVRAFIDKSADTIDWLEEMGVAFIEPMAYFAGSHFTWHVVKPVMGAPGPGCAVTMFKAMTERAKALGIDIMLQTSVKELVKQGDRITGVIAEDNSGERMGVASRTVVIATGGFGDSPKLIKKNTGYEWDKDLFSFRIPGIVGDGIRMALKAGAAPTETIMHLSFTMPLQLDVNPAIYDAFRQPHLMVNLHGERFMNEEVMVNEAFGANAIARQKDKVGFLIFDETAKMRMESIGYDFITPVFPNPKFNGDMDRAITDAQEKGYKGVFVADSLDELAAKTGIDGKTLKDTVKEYNDLCSRGHDDMFGKKHQYLRPITTPKFYAGANMLTGPGTLGGIKINHKMEVVDKAWKIIPGLYAAGSDANTVNADTFDYFLPGFAMGFALNSGRIAGENAAVYVKSQKK